MPGLVPGIHALTPFQRSKTWMASQLGPARVAHHDEVPQVGYTRLAVTSPAMTEQIVRTPMPTHNLLLLAGDGIGPEVMAEVKKLIAWMNQNGMGTFAFE